MKNEDNIKDDLHKQCKGVFCHCTNSPCDVLCRMVQSWSLHWKLDIILLAIKILKGRVITKTLVQRFINICEIPNTTVCVQYYSCLSCGLSTKSWKLHVKLLMTTWPVLLTFELNLCLWHFFLWVNLFTNKMRKNGNNNTSKDLPIAWFVNDPQLLQSLTLPQLLLDFIQRSVWKPGLMGTKRLTDRD